MAINLYGREAIAPQSESDPHFEDDVDKLDIPIHALDLIIADECHRGYTAKEKAVWRNVLEYFDAIKIGLTATPARHSLSLFNEVIYRFTTEEAIESGFLVDYDAVRVKSSVRLEGAFLKEGEHIGLIDTETGTRKRNFKRPITWFITRPWPISSPWSSTPPVRKSRF
jgi:type I restriction enzyme, R subunit